jgi:rRNA maturation endonuclease Nob1
MNLLSGIIPPKRTDKRVLRCAACGKVFMGKLIPFLAKCPQCGSRRVKADTRVSY